MDDEARSFLTRLFEAAVAAADPEKILCDVLPERPKGRTVVVGAGKGSAQLAKTFEGLWEGSLSGVVVTRYGYGVSCETIEVIEASHPVPDEAGIAATDALFSAVNGLTKDDLVVALICGGGSALLPAPPDGLTLADEQELNRVLLSSGAPISIMNAIRKQVSMIKGGRLAAAAHPARVVSLIVSDVPGDDPAQVASGPTVPDDVSVEDALALIEAHKIEIPNKVMEHLKKNGSPAPRPQDEVFRGNSVQIIASAKHSLEAAVKVAKEQGVEAVILSDAIEGEAREVALVHGAIAREIIANNRPFTAPVVLLSGGETTVTLRGSGKGGRNSEFTLALALSLDGTEGVCALAADTDGIDGSEDNAGAFVDGGTAARLRLMGMDPTSCLTNNDAWSAFDLLGDLFMTGPTGTNVNDFRAIYIEGSNK
ncbi:MAG: glycerate kinase [Rhizobiaceae bacterium]